MARMQAHAPAVIGATQHLPTRLALGLIGYLSGYEKLVLILQRACHGAHCAGGAAAGARGSASTACASSSRLAVQASCGQHSSALHQGRRSAFGGSDSNAFQQQQLQPVAARMLVALQVSVGVLSVETASGRAARAATCQLHVGSSRQSVYPLCAMVVHPTGRGQLLCRARALPAPAPHHSCPPLSCVQAQRRGSSSSTATSATAAPDAVVERIEDRELHVEASESYLAVCVLLLQQCCSWPLGGRVGARRGVGGGHCTGALSLPFLQCPYRPTSPTCWPFTTNPPMLPLPKPKRPPF